MNNTNQPNFSPFFFVCFFYFIDVPLTMQTFPTDCFQIIQKCVNTQHFETVELSFLLLTETQMLAQTNMKPTTRKLVAYLNTVVIC